MNFRSVIYYWNSKSEFSQTIESIVQYQIDSTQIILLQWIVALDQIHLRREAVRGFLYLLEYISIYVPSVCASASDQTTNDRDVKFGTTSHKKHP